MKLKYFWLVMIVGVLMLPMVLGQEEEESVIKSPEEAIKPITDVLDRVMNAITYVGGSIAALLLVVVGILYAMSNDPSDREKYKNWLKSIIIGLIIIVLAPQIVKVIKDLVRVG